MIQAAARGIIDFKSEVRFDDRSWFRKLAWILDDIERQNSLELLKLRNESYCAILTRTQQDESLELFLGELDAIKGSVFDNYFPYLAGFRNDNEERDKQPKQVKEMSDQWQTIFGNPDDPVVQDKIQKTIVKMETPRRGKKRKS